MAKYLLLFDLALLVTMITAYDFERSEEYEIVKVNRRPASYGTHWWDKNDGDDDDQLPYTPYVASIMGSYDYHCTGAVVQEYFIVTTATCCLKTVASEGAYITVAGLDPRRVRISYDTYFYPPDFDEATKEGDICLIHLVDPLKGIKPIKLPSLPLQSSVSALFYYTRELKMVRVHNFEKSECALDFPFGKFNEVLMLCAGEENNTKGACDVPSGGLLTYQGVLYGLASWSLKCTLQAEQDPMVFTDVWANLPFIVRTLEMNE